MIAVSEDNAKLKILEWWTTEIFSKEYFMLFELNFSNRPESDA